jgi:ABC-type methionine transport system ATPase subunit
MPRKSASPPRAKSAASRGPKETSRLWLMYPPRLITDPVIWQLARKFELVTNVRQASVTDEIGIVCLELQGAGEEIQSAIRWLERLGISVEPVEITVMES